MTSVHNFTFDKLSRIGDDLCGINERDLQNKDKNEVFVFNGWTFSSSPTVRPFDHPVYDIWLIKCTG